MIIRLADVDKDRDAILSGLHDFISRMDFQEFVIEDRAEFEAHFMGLMAGPTVDIIVADDEGDLVAGLGLFYSPLFWNPKVMHAEELFWWAADRAPKSAAMRVLRFAIAGIDNIDYDGKKMISFKSLTSSPASVGKVYEHLGLREIETSYMRFV
jgi:hypothetical protein